MSTEIKENKPGFNFILTFTLSHILRDQKKKIL